MTSLPSITVRMTEKDVARLKAISADMGIPYSEYARNILLDAMNERESPQTSLKSQFDMLSPSDQILVRAFVSRLLKGE